MRSRAKQGNGCPQRASDINRADRRQTRSKPPTRSPRSLARRACREWMIKRIAAERVIELDVARRYGFSFTRRLDEDVAVHLFRSIDHVIGPAPRFAA